MSRESHMDLAAALNALPRRQGQALSLRISGMSLPEIAAKMGIGYRTVQTHLLRSRKKIRQKCTLKRPAARYIEVEG